MGSNLIGRRSCYPGKKNAGADALSCSPVDQDDDGIDSPSLSMIEDFNTNEILVVATVAEDDAKSRVEKH